MSAGKRFQEKAEADALAEAQAGGERRYGTEVNTGDSN